MSYLQYDLTKRLLMYAQPEYASLFSAPALAGCLPNTYASVPAWQPHSHTGIAGWPAQSYSQPYIGAQSLQAQQPYGCAAHWETTTIPGRAQPGHNQPAGTLLEGVLQRIQDAVRAAPVPAATSGSCEVQRARKRSRTGDRDEEGLDWVVEMGNNIVEGLKASAVQHNQALTEVAALKEQLAAAEKRIQERSHWVPQQAAHLSAERAWANLNEYMQAVMKKDTDDDFVITRGRVLQDVIATVQEWEVDYDSGYVPDGLLQPCDVTFMRPGRTKRCKAQAEPGQDEGGLTAEMYTLLWEELKAGASPSRRPLFEKSEDGDASKYHVAAPADAEKPGWDNGFKGRDGGYSEKELAGYRVVGMMMAKSVTETFHEGDDRIPITIPSDLGTPFLLDFLLGKEVTIASPAGSISTQELLKSDIEDILGTGHFLLPMMRDPNYNLGDICFDMATEGEDDAQRAVTHANKEEFMRAFVQHHLIDSRRDALEAMRDGFQQAQLTEHLRAFSRSDRQDFMCGRDSFTAQELWDCLQFEGPDDPEDERWQGWGELSWNIVRFYLLSYFHQPNSQANLKLFLRFVASCTSLPKNLKIKVVPDLESVDHLPVAQTCFQTLKLPAYPSLQVLADKFSQAMLQGMEFGMQ